MSPYRSNCAHLEFHLIDGLAPRHHRRQDPTDMTLAADLDAHAATAADRIPAQARAVLNRSIESVASIPAGAVGIGDHAPDFTLTDQLGRLVTLRDLLVDGPVVVSFYRGGWCPYCNLELRALQAALPEFEAAGAALVAISPQTPDETLSTTEKNELGFRVLSDVGSNTSRHYGLVFTLQDDARDLYRSFGNDLTRINGTDSWELPLPATYVIAPDGIVTFAVVDPDYRHRAEPADVVAAVRATR